MSIAVDTDRRDPLAHLASVATQSTLVHHWKAERLMRRDAHDAVRIGLPVRAIDDDLDDGRALVLPGLEGSP